MPPEHKRDGKPEEKVRQRVIAELKKLGWKDTRLRWKPEWSVPDTPNDLTKRERGQLKKSAAKGAATRKRQG